MWSAYFIGMILAEPLLRAEAPSLTLEGAQDCTDFGQVVSMSAANAASAMMFEGRGNDDS